MRKRTHSKKKQVDLLAVLENQVVRTGGAPLGEIDSLVASVGDGRIEHAILRLADRSAGPKRYVLIPWSQFTLSADGYHLQLDFSLELLRAIGTDGR